MLTQKYLGMLARLMTLTIVLISLLSTSGCGIFSPEESRGPGETPPVVFPPATTPDQLIENFRSAYEQRNIVEYEKLIHDDFEFTFAAQDVIDLGLPEDSWDSTTELAATRRMFEGADGIDPVSGQPTPAITKITLTLLEEIDWTTDNDGDPRYEGTQHKIFRVSMNVTLRGGDDQRVGGNQDFYVILDPEAGVYKLKIWNDLGTSVGGG